MNGIWNEIKPKNKGKNTLWVAIFRDSIGEVFFSRTSYLWKCHHHFEYKRMRKNHWNTTGFRFVELKVRKQTRLIHPRLETSERVSPVVKRVNLVVLPGSKKNFIFHLSFKKEKNHSLLFSILIFVLVL